MVLRHNGTAHDAADIFQDALLDVYKRAKQNDFILTGPLEPFLYVVCKNKWHKKKIKNNAAGVTNRWSEGNTIGEAGYLLAEEYLISRERKELVSKKLAELGQNCRQLISLSLGGASMFEVAAALNITYAYARKKKSECLAKLVALVKQSPEYKQLRW